MPDQDPVSYPGADNPPAQPGDPFIEVFTRDYTFRWYCGSCGHEDDTAWIASEDASRAGEEHSCLDHLGT